MPEPTRGRWGKMALGPRTRPGLRGAARDELALPPGREGRALCCAPSLSRVRLCNPVGCSARLLCPFLPGILQARILKWVAVSFSHGPVAKLVSSSLRAPLPLKCGIGDALKLPECAPRGPAGGPLPLPRAQVTRLQGAALRELSAHSPRAAQSSQAAVQW